MWVEYFTYEAPKPGDWRPRDWRPEDWRPGVWRPRDWRPRDWRPGDRRPGDWRPRFWSQTFIFIREKRHVAFAGSAHLDLFIREQIEGK